MGSKDIIYMVEDGGFFFETERTFLDIPLRAKPEGGWQADPNWLKNQPQPQADTTGTGLKNTCVIFDQSDTSANVRDLNGAVVAALNNPRQGQQVVVNRIGTQNGRSQMKRRGFVYAANTSCANNLTACPSIVTIRDTDPATLGDVCRFHMIAFRARGEVKPIRSCECRARYDNVLTTDIRRSHGHSAEQSRRGVLRRTRCVI